MTPRKRTKPLRDGPGRPPIDPNYDTVVTTVRLTRAQDRRLKELAEQFCTTPSEVVRWLIDSVNSGWGWDEWLKRQEKKK